MKKGFSLIEIIVVIGVIVALSGVAIVFGERSRTTARDERRKVDLQTIQAGMEEFRAHCGGYLSEHSYYDRFNPPYNGNLTGYDWIANLRGLKTCTSTNVFMEQIPQDPLDPARIYRYNRVASGRGYVICAALENPPNPPMDVSQCIGDCGSGVACNYKVDSPFN